MCNKADDKRICKVCGTKKPLTEFVRDSRTSSGHITTCKACRGKMASVRIHDTNRRARAAGVKIDLTVEDIDILLRTFDNEGCIYCGADTTKLEIEHTIPLSRAGEHSVKNLTMCCRKCNRTKHNRSLIEFYNVSGTFTSENFTTVVTYLALVNKVSRGEMLQRFIDDDIAYKRYEMERTLEKVVSGE